MIQNVSSSRLEFKRDKHWRESILQFTKLLFEIVYEGKKEVVEIMIKHESFLSFVVQCSFWGKEHRPDIVKVLSVENVNIHIDDELGAIVGTGRAIIKLMAMDTNHEGLLEGGKNLLEVIGMMPIVSKAYNPTCTVSFAEGFVRRLRTSTSEWDSGEFRVLYQLIVVADCVDRELVKEVIDLCLNYICRAEVEYAQALHLTMMSCTMMFPGKNARKKHPSDTRVAFAIRAGLIEMCLGFIEYFGGHESYGIKIGRLSMFDSVGTILKTVYDISLHQKTAKAIRSKKKDIEEKLVSLEEDERISSNPKCKGLLDMVKSTLSLNGSYCCRCNKSLSKTEVMQCNGCGRMAYCSKACQREDWQNGHELACCKSYTYEHAGQFQGRVWPRAIPSNERDAAKMKDLEINMNMIQQKLFLDNSETILNQVKALGIPLYDCVIRFDLRECPTTVEVEHYGEFFTAVEERKGFEDSRSKENITCLYLSNIFYGELDDSSGDVPLLELQRLFPHEWLKQNK